MTEIVNQNGTETSLAETAKKVKPNRQIPATPEAIAKLRAGTDNKAINASIAEPFYGTCVEYLYNLQDGDAYPYRDSEAGQAILKDGAMAWLIRTSVAARVGYAGEVVFVKRQPAVDAKTTQAAAFRGSAALVFSTLRDQIDEYGLAEEQVKSKAFAKLKLNAQTVAPDMSVTDEVLEAIWAEEKEKALAPA